MCLIAKEIPTAAIRGCTKTPSTGPGAGAGDDAPVWFNIMKRKKISPGIAVIALWHAIRF